jgi:CubicO group peptidase (beta-lactamase class C family)
VKIAAVLILTLPFAPSMGAAQEIPVSAERWVGGLHLEDDYTALVLRLWRSDRTTRAEVTYPNQLRTVTFDEATVAGSSLVLRSGLRQETWSGEIEGTAVRGRFRDPEGEAQFELFLAPEGPAATLYDWQGTYRWPDGKRVGIEVLTRPTDRLLMYFDERSGEEQWLFPETDSTYYAGPNFETPRPVRHRAHFTHDARGRPLLHWSTGDSAPVEAARVPDLPDTLAIDSIARGFMARQDVPSVVIGIVGRRGLLWGKAYGYADRGRQRAATLTTPYQIGSLTKLMTATVLLGLRDSGLLRLDDNISHFLPRESGIPALSGEADAGVTLWGLLTHTAGLPGNPVNRVDVDGVMQPFSNANLLAGLPHTRLQSRPGTRWSYSNLGYAILGYIMAKRTGRSFAQLLRTRLFEPLGMTDSRITLSPADESRLAVHYWPEDSIRVPRPRWVFGEVAGFGGVTSTVPDLARFAALQFDAGLVESSFLAGSTLAEMQRPQFIRPGWSQAMGLGWWIRRDAVMGTIHLHGGEVDGHSSYLALSREQNLAVIVLANLGGATANNLGELILRETIAAARERTLPSREWAFARFLDSDWGPASWALEPVAAARPTDGVAWFRLGVARFQLDRYDEAARAFSHASSLDFFPEQALFYLARVRAIQQDREAAIGFLEQAVARGFRNLAAIRDQPEFGFIREDPRVSALLR